jgi:hypothetical protein
MFEPNALETAVLTKLFCGDHAGLSALRRQLSIAKVASRKMTGVGFYTTFTLPPETLRAPVRPGKLCFGDVEAKLPALRNGAGFVVYVEEGMLHMLEGYTYDEPWPEQTGDIFELSYTDPTRQTALRTLGSP